MRFILILAIVVLVGANIPAGEPARLTFERGKIGELPPGWKTGVTGKGATESVWKIVEDKSAPGGPLVLHQTSKNPGSAFNVCLAEGAGKYKDVDIAISLKAIAGEMDQGGGIVWRARDKDNFYIVRFN